MLLEAYKVDIDEFDVGEGVLRRLNNSCLTEADIDAIDAMRPVRPSRYHDYIDDRHYEWLKDGMLWREFRPIIPMSQIDNRMRSGLGDGEQAARADVFASIYSAHRDPRAHREPKKDVSNQLIRRPVSSCAAVSWRNSDLLALCNRKLQSAN